MTARVLPATGWHRGHIPGFTVMNTTTSSSRSLMGGCALPKAIGNRAYGRGCVFPPGGIETLAMAVTRNGSLGSRNPALTIPVRPREHVGVRARNDLSNV